MILYVNGCSHTAAAEAVVPACFAQDNGRHGIDRRPHPINLAASWCTHVANALKMTLVCDAESGASNPRIVRTTKAWLEQNQDQWTNLLVVIQWTTWEREEWLYQGTWYQVNASGQDWVPAALRDRYKKFIAEVDWQQATQQCHSESWQLHQWLTDKKIAHVFFNGHSSFSDILDQKFWGRSFIYPYDRSQSYHNWLIDNGGQYANPKSYHFDAKSHRLWANHVLQYLYRNQIVVAQNEVSAD